MSAINYTLVALEYLQKLFRWKRDEAKDEALKWPDDTYEHNYQRGKYHGIQLAYTRAAEEISALLRQLNTPTIETAAPQRYNEHLDKEAAQAVQAMEQSIRRTEREIQEQRYKNAGPRVRKYLDYKARRGVSHDDW